MSAPEAIRCTWDGDALVPDGRVWTSRADRVLVVGEHYMVECQEPRSLESHRHYFACVNSAWENLPEDLAERFPTADALRKYALIRAGYRDERSITCASKAEAQRLAAFIKPMDDFALVVVSEATVTVYIAKSQSMRAMGKAEFQASKDKVLDVLAQMVGTTADELAKHGEAA